MLAYPPAPAAPFKESGNPPTDDDLSEDMEPTSMSGLFNDASLYRQAIAEHEPGVYLAFPPGITNAAQRSVHDFAELVGNDLDPEEKDVARRLAQIAAPELASPEDGKQLSLGILTQEPESLDDEDDFEEAPSRSETETSVTSAVLSDESSATSAPKVADEELPVLLAPDEIIGLLREEFGALGPEGEEKLVSEIDAAIIQDVVILVH